MHRNPKDCKDGLCSEGKTICDHARKSSCQEVGCDPAEVERSCKPKAKPDIHFGSVASGDRVMRSGEERDKLAETEGVSAFDMEAAGVWEYLPCILVKGVCDYADSHKNKAWQEYAALAAAACTKAVLEQWPKKGEVPADQVCLESRSI
jgi:nucleoside phosphorylase